MVLEFTENTAVTIGGAYMNTYTATTATPITTFPNGDSRRRHVRPAPALGFGSAVSV